MLASAVAVGGGGLVFGVPPGLIVFAKRRRRDRRRRRPDAPGQVSGAWDELLDNANDLGRPVQAAITRREAATQLLEPSIAHLAADADAATFGAHTPDERFVAAYWHRVDESIAAIGSGLSARARLRAKLSTASLRKQRRSVGDTT